MSEKKSKVNISEINAQAKITVMALMDKKKIELPAKLAQLSDQELAELSKFGKNVLPLESIVQQKEKDIYIVSFSGHISVLGMIVVNSDGVFLWDHIQIKKHVFSTGKIIHLVVALVPDGKRHNRRRGIRINIDTTMTLEQGESKYLVLLKDLSYCGLSFVNLSPEEPDYSQPFLIHLTEKNEDKSFLIAKIITKVHRSHETKDGITVYGCIVHEKHANLLQRYIALKQMEAVNGKRPIKEVQKTSNKETWRADVAEALNDLINEEQQ